MSDLIEFEFADLTTINLVSPPAEAGHSEWFGFFRGNYFEWGPDGRAKGSTDPRIMDFLGADGGKNVRLFTGFEFQKHWSLLPGLLRESLEQARKFQRRHIIIFYSLDVLHAVTELLPDERAEIAVYAIRADRSVVRYSGEELVTVVREQMEIR